jgi:Zn ribbon nucleic-acid-binding protein
MLKKINLKSLNYNAKRKAKKHCPQCETKYTIEWDIEEQDLEPLTCPFCGYEVELEDEEEG